MQIIPGIITNMIQSGTIYESDDEMKVRNAFA